MVVLSILVFAAALAASVGAIIATVLPRWEQIVDLVRHGAVVEQAPLPVSRRSGRPISVSVRRPAPNPQRAAA